MRPASLLHAAGWLCLVLMLLLASPGVRLTESPQAPAAQAVSQP